MCACVCVQIFICVCARVCGELVFATFLIRPPMPWGQAAPPIASRHNISIHLAKAWESTPPAGSPLPPAFLMFAPSSYSIFFPTITLSIIICIFFHFPFRRLLVASFTQHCHRSESMDLRASGGWRISCRNGRETCRVRGDQAGLLPFGSGNICFRGCGSGNSCSRIWFWQYLLFFRGFGSGNTCF